MNVQKVNIEQEKQDNYKSLLLLDEISKGEPLSQRDLSKKLNIALGLVNSYMKNLVAKGYITVKDIPAKRYAYYLTPKGFAEKTRLTYHHLQNYTSLYRNARRDFKDLFARLSANEVRNVFFAGVDEIAEIAYLSLQETEIHLAGIVDEDAAETDFLRHRVMSYDALVAQDFDAIIVTAFLKRERVHHLLIEHGVPAWKVHAISHFTGMP